MVHYRHLRRRHASRIRHSQDLQAFVAAENARLATASAKAAGTLTLGATPGDGKVVVIGGKTYTFQTTLTEADGHVHIGASATTAATNLFNAINKSGGGTAGTDYANATVANPDFVATNPVATHVVITAKVAGARTDATTTNSVSGSWGAATVQGGVDAAGFDTVKSLKLNTADQIVAAQTSGALH